ncbi:hypothetical protein NUU61_000586 [Penicillium alfredii]|uniref:Uncharacterized protein n=1 Tax=Penicillium alfredii TaxID=1506179 RepID=A0A9W9KR13_9EURO|nr:uncharacterized protein NUU61_000586 [Penicillium alfredii]KAJ5114827.1 hypothetical protein NUU61_000586 [Penicillium alfredii]
MRYLGLALAVLSTYALAVTALPSPEELGTLKYRSWDLRLFNAAIPACNPNASNIARTVLHRSGANTRTCALLDYSLYNTSSVQSLSWKSPGPDDVKDLCMFRTQDCSGGEQALVGAITSGWEVCYPFLGWRGWVVVEHGAGCF